MWIKSRSDNKKVFQVKVEELFELFDFLEGVFKDCGGCHAHAQLEHAYASRKHSTQ